MVKLFAKSSSVGRSLLLEMRKEETAFEDSFGKIKAKARPCADAAPGKWDVTLTWDSDG